RRSSLRDRRPSRPVRRSATAPQCRPENSVRCVLRSFATFTAIDVKCHCDRETSLYRAPVKKTVQKIIMSQFPPVAEQLAIIRRGVEKIVPANELAGRLEHSRKSGTPLRVKYGIDP